MNKELAEIQEQPSDVDATGSAAAQPKPTSSGTTEAPTGPQPEPFPAATAKVPSFF